MTGLVEVDGAVVNTRQDYESLSSQLAKVSPTGPAMEAYNPTNTPHNCPPNESGWSVLPVLPTTPPIALANVQDGANPSGQTSQSSNNASPATNSGTGTYSPSSGLGMGARIGIGVGVGLGVALLLLLGGCVFWRRRRRSKQNAWPDPADGNERREKASRSGADDADQMHELEQPRPELPADEQRQQLPAPHGDSEMGRSTSSAIGKGIESRHELPAS